MTTPQTFSDFIQQRRHSVGLTQADLAERLSVTRTTVTNWETGFRLPTTRRLYQLFKGLSLSMAQRQTALRLHAAAASSLAQAA